MYKSNTRIVTCVYYSSRESEMGGRGWHEDFYRHSLTNIFNMGLPVTIFCYDNPNVIQSLQKIINNCKDNINPDINVELRYHDITSHPLYPQITKTRNSIIETLNEDRTSYPNGFYWTRCEVLCHTKLWFIQQVFNSDPTIENCIWMDAGITHWGINPKSKGGVEINGLSETIQHFFPYNSQNMFNPSVGKGLESLMTKHPLIFIGHGQNWYDSNLFNINASFIYDNPEYKGLLNITDTWKKDKNGIVCKIYNTEYNEIWEPIILFEKQIVGGIICVNRLAITPLTEFYNKYLTYLLSYPRKVLFTEEPILSLYYILYKPKLLEFNEWSHNVYAEPPNPCTVETENTKSFYTIWEDIVNSHC